MRIRGRMRTVLRVACSAGTLVSLVMVTLSTAAVVGGTGDPAVAAGTRAGDAQVVTPATASDPLAPLTSGGSATPFTLKLPAAASCAGDSTLGGYKVQSYMVPTAIDPATLTFGSAGPTGGANRFPLYDTTGSSFVNKQTSNAPGAGQPGPVNQPLPAFDFAVYAPGDVTPGSYNVGIACTLGPASPTQLDRFWNVHLKVTATASDSPAQLVWEVEQPPTTTTVALVVSPSGSSTPGATVTLSATVAPATAAGTVTFKDGSDDLGAPVTVAAGSAQTTTSALAAGAHTLSATFTPASTTFAASTSTVVSHSVAAAETTTSSTTPSGSTATTLNVSSGGTTTTTNAAAVAGTGAAAGDGTTVAGTGGQTIAGQLPTTGGGHLGLLVWSFFLLCFGRAAILLSRTPRVIDVA